MYTFSGPAFGNSNESVCPKITLCEVGSLPGSKLQQYQPGTNIIKLLQHQADSSSDELQQYLADSSTHCMTIVDETGTTTDISGMLLSVASLYT